jgi:mono/diheme cytochrome c family protein
MKNRNFIALLLLLTNLHATPTGKELFIQKCTSCHSIEMPKTKKNLLAPPAVGLMFHLNEHFDNEEDLISHIKSFTMNPQREKAVCKSVRKFGVMPSQKNNVTEEELTIIAEWLTFDIFITKRKYLKERKEMFAN